MHNRSTISLTNLSIRDIIRCNKTIKQCKEKRDYEREHGDEEQGIGAYEG